MNSRRLQAIRALTKYCGSITSSTVVCLLDHIELLEEKMSDKTDKIELSAECLREYLVATDRDDLSPEACRARLRFRQRARQALAAHEAKQNPLGLPWWCEQEDNGYWRVWTNNGDFDLASAEVTEAQAKLIAAAPEAFELLAHLLGSDNIVDDALEGEAVRALLKKAGWTND